MVRVNAAARNLRGGAYTVEEFRERYGLKEDEAVVLMEKFGPSKVDIDLLMSAKGRQPVARR